MPEARYEQREALELAFIAALQHLPARQRAVLILRDVLGFSACEVGQLLDTTVTAVNSTMQRARRTLDERLADQTQQSALRRLGDERTRDLVTQFADPLERGDVDQIVEMLVEDATFTMPPYAAWYWGRLDVAASWLMPGGPRPRLRLVPTRASGQLALALYRLEPETASYQPLALDVLTVRGDRIAEVTAFRAPALVRHFALPDQIPAGGTPGRRSATPTGCAQRGIAGARAAGCREPKRRRFRSGAQRCRHPVGTAHGRFPLCTSIACFGLAGSASWWGPRRPSRSVWQPPDPPVRRSGHRLGSPTTR